MALTKDKKPASPAAAGGGFETETPVTAPTDQEIAKAGVSASTAIAKASASAIVLSGEKALYGKLERALPKLDFGTIPRLVATQGVFKDGDKKSLGNFVEVELLSWNKNFVVSPGDDSDEAKEAVRYSSDGETIDETGEDVKSYLAKLRETDGYEKANVKEYLEIVGVLTKSDKSSEHVGNMVQLSLSPQSRKNFEGFRLQESVKVARGARQAADCNFVRFDTEARSFNNNDFTVMKPSVIARSTQ